MAKNYVIDGGTGELDVGGNTLANRFDLPEAMVPQNLGQRYNIGGRVGFEKGTIKPVLNDQESFLEWTQENIGEEAKGSKFLGTAWDALSDPIKSGFGGEYDARTIFPNLDSVSQTALNVLAPWGEKAFDIIDAAWRLPGAAAADIATMAGADEGSVKKLQAEMNVALGIPLGRVPKMIKKFKSFITPKFTNQTQIKGVPQEMITKKVPSKYLGQYIKQNQKGDRWLNTFSLRLPVRKTKKSEKDIRKVQTSSDLASLMKKRNEFVLARQVERKALTDKDWVTHGELYDYLSKNGIPISEKSVFGLAKNWKLKNTIDPVPQKNKSFLYKLPDAKKLKDMQKNVKTDDLYKKKVEVAQQLITDNNLKTQDGLNRALDKKGYKGFTKGLYLKKLFPELIAEPGSGAWLDTPKSSLTHNIINRKMRDLKKEVSGIKTEKFITKSKQALDYGEDVHLMHTYPKLKMGKKVHGIEDLALGTAKENLAYASQATRFGKKGPFKEGAWDMVRTNLNKEMRRLKNKYNVKDADEVINIPKDMQKNYKLPKTLTVGEYIDRINTGLTDLAHRTKGKVRGELLIDQGGKYVFTDNPFINYKDVPGMGLIKGKVKDFEKLMQKVSYGKGDLLLLDDTGLPKLKKGANLTQDEAETLLTIFKNIKTQLPKIKGKPWKGKLKFATGGPVVPRIEYRDGTRMSAQPPKEKSFEEIIKELQIQYGIPDEEGFAVKDKLGRLGDIVDVRNYPYYGSKVGKGIMEAAEFSVRFPGAAGQLIHDVATGPGWKQQGLDFIKNVSPGWGWSEKVGLDSLIDEQVGAMKERGSSDAPASLGGVLNLGADIAMPLGYVYGAAKFGKFIKALGQTPDKISDFNKRIIDHLDSTGRSKREFMTLVGSVGAMGAIKAMGLDKIFNVGKVIKGADDMIPMVKGSYSTMPKWFPMFIQKINPKMIYEGDGMSTFTGTDDFLPGIRVEKNGDDYLVYGKNEYGQDWTVSYEGPRWLEIEAGQKPVYFKGEFEVVDEVPAGMRPEDVEFEPEVIKEIDELLGGNGRSMEEFATGHKIEGLTKGEKQVDWAEGRAQQAMDEAAEIEAGVFDEVN